jgi:hypothetical protein
LPKTGTSKPILGGRIDIEPLKDNGVPGPGMYECRSQDAIPSFVMSNPKTSPRKQEHDSKEEPLGPQRYSPHKPGEQFFGQKFPGQTLEDAYSPERFGSFGNNARGRTGAVIEDENIKKKREAREKMTQYLGVPGPGNYKITGDFDFRDPTRPDDRTGKNPKFCFGTKTAVRNKNIDMPGPGEYDTDVLPMNQANVSYWIGTDVRRDLAVPYSHMYPGPGNYDAEEIKKPTSVSFPKDIKNKPLVKTNDPGPGSYAHYETVGV